MQNVLLEKQTQRNFPSNPTWKIPYEKTTHSKKNVPPVYLLCLENPSYPYLKEVHQFPAVSPSPNREQ
jgi:hypothetical protein